MIRITPIFEVTIESGQIVWPEGENLRLVKFLYGRSGKYQLYLKRPLKRRSLAQNNWFHGIILSMIAEAMGEDDLGYVKAVLKAKFLSKEIVLAGKDNQWEKIMVIGRTSKLKTDQFNDFCEKCRKFAAEFYGLNIPDPEEVMPELLTEED